jgi:hypothetical protein
MKTESEVANQRSRVAGVSGGYTPAAGLDHGYGRVRRGVGLDVRALGVAVVPMLVFPVMQRGWPSVIRADEVYLASMVAFMVAYRWAMADRDGASSERYTRLGWIVGQGLVVLSGLIGVTSLTALPVVGLQPGMRGVSIMVLQLAAIVGGLTLGGETAMHAGADVEVGWSDPKSYGARQIALAGIAGLITLFASAMGSVLLTLVIVRLWWENRNETR